MSVYDIGGNVLCPYEPPVEYTDEQCTTAFLSYMAEKAALFGMTGTYYENPSGLTSASYSTPRDEMKLGTVVATNPRACEIWSTPSRSFPIKGDNARTLAVTSNIIGGENATYLNENGYKFLGGKGGSLIRDGYHKAAIYAVEIEEKAVLLGAMVTGQTAYNNAKYIYKEICDMIKAQINGQAPTAGANLSAALSAGGGFATCIIPANANLYQTQGSPADLLLRTNSLSSAPTVRRIPASTTKTMTMLCALDYFKDIHETIAVKTVDIVGGSGSTFYDGDMLTFWDAVRIMMMESSNTLANTIARETGRKILSYAV